MNGPMTTRKQGTIPRLEQLPAAQQQTLIAWLSEERITYAQAQARLKAEFGVRTSASALSHFWKAVCQPRIASAAVLQDTSGHSAATVLLTLQLRRLADGAVILAVSTAAGEETRLPVNL